MNTAPKVRNEESPAYGPPATQASRLSELVAKAAQAAQMAADDLRQAQREACSAPGAQAIELLLREALADASRLAYRLTLIASVAEDVAP